MRTTSTFLLSALLAGSAALAGCGDSRPQTSDDVAGSALDLVLVGGARLDTVQYAVTGPGGLSRSGSVDVSHSATVSLSLGLPAGGPYTLSLTGASTDGGTTCAGSATFSVMAGATTSVPVHLVCREAPRNGGIVVNGTINVCAQLDSVTVTPSEVAVGGTIALVASAHDTDAAPAALGYAWKATGGTLSASDGASVTFTCKTPGPATISVSATDGDAACTDAQSIAVTCTKNTTTVAMFGDWPYGDVINGAQAFIDQVNADPDIDLSVHVGDIHSGSQKCSAAYNQSIFGLFQKFVDPLVYTPGDNEWTDCQKVKEGSSGYPIDELANLRALFFAQPGKTLGAAPMTVLSQANAFDPSHPEDAAYVENVIFEKAQVTFVTLNVPGSNDDRLPWAAPFSNPTAQADEIAKRDAANARWLDKAFAIATANHDAAVLIALQADMFDPAAFVPGGDGLSGYDALVAQIAKLSLAFGKPVLLVNGDSHLYEADHPLADPASATYAMHPVPGPVANLTRITVDGSTNFKDWVKLTVDPTTPAVFSFVRVFTP